MGIAKHLGEPPSLTAVLVILTGIIGAFGAQMHYARMKCRDPAVQGFAWDRYGTRLSDQRTDRRLFRAGNGSKWAADCHLTAHSAATGDALARLKRLRGFRLLAFSNKREFD